MQPRNGYQMRRAGHAQYVPLRITDPAPLADRQCDDNPARITAVKIRGYRCRRTLAAPVQVPAATDSMRRFRLMHVSDSVNTLCEQPALIIEASRIHEPV